MNVKLVIGRVSAPKAKPEYDWKLLCGRFVISSVRNYTTAAGARRAGRDAADGLYTYRPGYNLYEPLCVVKTERKP
ncbi:hypothetical protein LCGC14_2306740 [marine sediment metagenome]|uniref:Uncharacterized protein n=1 Tax=marine sediment metagenome TaxID=412755 RepID=A0A0F9CLX9_9ZZZZ